LVAFLFSFLMLTSFVCLFVFFFYFFLSFRFATSSWSVENLLFHRRVQEYKRVPAEKLMADARLVFEQYLVEGSEREINVDMTMKESIMERIDENRVDYTLFDPAESHALNLLRYSVLPLWKGTVAFKEALKRLKVNTIEELGFKEGGKRNASAVSLTAGKPAHEEQLTLEDGL